MTVRDLRRKFIEFFESKGHTPYPSGSLVPYDVTGRLDESLLFNGAGMVQFKPYFRGVADPPNRRLLTVQKCVRTGDIESVGDTSHLTFFEMLGNFSFGDYFKELAIDLSWEFLTDPRWLGLDPRRLAFTVFHEDEEAFSRWSHHLAGAGIEPSSRIFRLGEETNYWPAGAFSSGPPGPCGPNSEMFYWTPKLEPPPDGLYGIADYTRDEAAGKWLEIWNDVFIQFEWKGELRDPERPSSGYRKSGMDPLPFASVDTGMGLERTAAVLAGLQSVYDTDAFVPIIRQLEALAEGRLKYGEHELGDRAVRIICDHIRTASFCIADGVLPGNSGRGYVLRRLIRRAVLTGRRRLAFEEPFLHELFLAVAETFGGYYRELVERADTIRETLFNEETLFGRTLAAGSQILEAELQHLRREGQTTLQGEAAFRLYGTFGFPLEVTQEIAAESGVSVDLEGFERSMRQAQELSRGVGGQDNVYAGVEIRFQFIGQQRPTPTRFVGYETGTARARVVGVLPMPDENDAWDGELALALDQTPFYAESGGQVSDTGYLQVQGVRMDVLDVVNQEGVYVHLTRPEELGADADMAGLMGQPLTSAAGPLMQRFFGKPADAMVDIDRRAAITRNHTATHLLHAALRRILGSHVAQAGSLVAPDHLRFDFTHSKALSSEQLQEIEQVVNEQALAGYPVEIYVDVPLAEARAKGAMALFGEKYGDRVRMVEVGEFSRELCGGIHVANTGQIGMFKIVHEGSAAGGVRRIEALTGINAFRWAARQHEMLVEASGLLKATPSGLVDAIERTLESLREERRLREKAQKELLQASGAQGAAAEASEHESVNGCVLWRPLWRDVDQRLAAEQVDQRVADNPSLVALAALINGDKISFICKVGHEAIKSGANAGTLVREVSKLAGGGGGGRPEFATAGGKDPAKVRLALDAGKELLERMLHGR